MRSLEGVEYETEIGRFNPAPRASTRGDALRFAALLPLAVIFRAFGAEISASPTIEGKLYRARRGVAMRSSICVPASSFTFLPLDAKTVTGGGAIKCHVIEIPS